MSGRAPIGVVGVGWVGLVTAACFAELGHRVVAMDIDESKVDALNGGDVPIHEPGLGELVGGNSERLTFTTSMDDVLAEARLLFVCVDTPPTYSGDADLSRVRAVVDGLPAEGDFAIVMKSTVPAGTGAAIKRDVPGLAYVSCPEFLKEGSAVEDFMHPDRVVIGADAGDEWAADEVAAAYEPLGGELVRTDVASAEMIKLASNAFLATKISFINEIANVSELVGADVTEVARGMGLDERIGPSFLRAGIGYGGSCFARDETLLVRLHGAARLVTFEELWALVDGDDLAVDGEALAPADLQVWSWVPGKAEPEWMPVSVLTKRHYQGQMVEVRTKMGRRVRVTKDHPFYVGDGKDGEVLTRVLAEELGPEHWLPLATGAPAGFEPRMYSTAGVLERTAVSTDKVRVELDAAQQQELLARPPREMTSVFGDRDPWVRMWHLRKGGPLRLSEAAEAGMDLGRARFTTVFSRVSVPPWMEIDERFWRVVGLYLAEGYVSRNRSGNDDADTGIVWSFHPSKEQHLVEEVVAYWGAHGIAVRERRARTSHQVIISSRFLATWWTEVLGLGRNAYEQRIPPLAWEQSARRKKALLSGLWAGDGNWTIVNKGRSPVLELGTVSDHLADGVARLLGDLGIIASWYRGRTKLSTKETHWLSISGAEQIRASLFLVTESARAEIVSAVTRQTKRMKPAGFRRFEDDGVAWVRVAKTERTRHEGPVYSLKVPGSQTVVVSGGVVASNCFPKDTEALRTLAGNTGYHFQLLNAVIQVNELQKRRVIGKLERHLGSLVGRKIALLGLAFKPDTDDMREASSLVLSARLQGEGATVRAYDPVAENAARDLLPNVDLAESVEDALDGADAVVLVTEWPEFAELDWRALRERMAHPLIVDGRNFLDAEALRAAGFTYEGIGRPNGDKGTS